VGLFRPLIDRQRLVNSFLTNIRGPAERLTFGGARITAMVPITITAGNVAAAFAVLSYAGTLMTTVIVDPDVVPDVDVLTAALQDELVTITNHSRQRPPSDLPAGPDGGRAAHVR
jgi:hypothetical protein